jgi:predicted PurR-regulated permease PerM
MRVEVSARMVAKVILTAVAVVAGLYTLWLIRTVIGVVFIAVFLAVALGPAVGFFERKLRLTRAPAIVATYISLGVAVTIIGFLVVPPIVEQTA